MSRDPKVTHRIMSAIKSTGTRPEIILRKKLWHSNMRYRVNYKNLPGKPDIVFTKQKVAIFCDGDFWHGHNWAVRGLPSLEDELSGYSEFWKNKILKNIERDDRNNKLLNSMGWTVIRLWESDIVRDPDMCLKTIREIMFECSLGAYEIDNPDE